MTHSHGDDACPLCPTDEQLAGMRERNRRETALRRADMLARIHEAPASYVFAVEARDGIGADIVMQMSSSLEKAREHCLGLPEREYAGECRYHVIPHLLDAPAGDTMTGVVSLAVYGMRRGSTKPEDLVGTDDE